VPSRREDRGMRFVGLGMEFAAAVAGLTLLGHWIDRKLGVEPWGLLIGAGIGLIGGMYNMIRVALTAAEPARPVKAERPTERPAEKPAGAPEKQVAGSEESRTTAAEP
jgi:F0F1-type ATP synthase assembly protein I